MPTEKEINSKYWKQHDELTTAFYAKKHSKQGATEQEQADFDNSHSLIWQSFEAEMIAEGYRQQPIFVDYKELYSQAADTEQKMDIIAKKLGLL